MTRRLTDRDEPALEELLMTDPVVNLFLLGFLAAHPIGRFPWYGEPTWSGRVAAAAVVFPDRLMVPYAPDPRHAARIGHLLRRHHRPSMMVGPRQACDAIWSTWAAGTRPRSWYDQRLYTLRDPPVQAPIEGFRRATFDEWPAVVALSAEMQLEDLGTDPRDADEAAYATQVQERVKEGRTFVVERGGRLVYTLNVGTRSPLGCQIGGTYVPPEARGRGIATAATAEAVRRLLQKHPVVTLHVNEANHAAVRVYEKIGFTPAAAYRLATVV